MIDTIVGINIALLRSRRNLPRDELSRMIGVPTEEFELVERGTRRATPAILTALSLALDVPISNFFQGWDDRGGGDANQ